MYLYITREWLSVQQAAGESSIWWRCCGRSTTASYCTSRIWVPWHLTKVSTGECLKKWNVRIQVTITGELWEYKMIWHCGNKMSSRGSNCWTVRGFAAELGKISTRKCLGRYPPLKKNCLLSWITKQRDHRLIIGYPSWARLSHPAALDRATARGAMWAHGGWKTELQIQRRNILQYYAIHQEWKLTLDDEVQHSTAIQQISFLTIHCETLTGGNGRFLQLRDCGRDLHPEAKRASDIRGAARCSVHLGVAIPVVMFVALLNLLVIFSCNVIIGSEQFVFAVRFNFPCQQGQLRFKLFWLHLCRVAQVEALVWAQGWFELRVWDLDCKQMRQQICNRESGQVIQWSDNSFCSLLW